MSNILSARTISASLPSAGRTLLADITANYVWSATSLQYFLGGSTALNLDSEFRDIYVGVPRHL